MYMSMQLKWYKSSVFTGVLEEDGDGDGKSLASFSKSAQITIVDAKGEAMAHGKMVDDEPDVSSQKLCKQYGTGTGYWKLIKLDKPLRGWGTTAIAVCPPAHLIILDCFLRLSCTATLTLTGRDGFRQQVQTHQSHQPAAHQLGRHGGHPHLARVRRRAHTPQKGGEEQVGC
jgi:hypothetical protein